MQKEFTDIIENICEQDDRYGGDAYEFVMEALSYTQKKHKNPRHITGGELLNGMKNLLIEKFGPMTMMVLNHWGINTTEDIGNIVFNLVENKILTKTEDDRIENFRDGFDFKEVFEDDYRQQLAKKISRMR